jgi:hypothetical protein
MTLAQALLANLKELLKVQRAASDSLFKFHITRLWPISIFAPKVDYERICRLMSECQKQVQDQRQFIAKEKPQAPAEDLPFIGLVPGYLEQFSSVCQKLEACARYKDNIAIQKIKGEHIPAIQSTKAWSALVRDYQAALELLTNTGYTLFKAWRG